MAGGEIFEEHLNLFKMILDRFAKYLLLPGVNIDININGKVSGIILYHIILFCYVMIVASVYLPIACGIK